MLRRSGRPWSGGSEREAGDGARLARDRKRVAFDRLLARLVAVAADAWVLKGGFALDLRLTERARMTKDIDLDWHEPGDELLDTLLDAADYDAGDFFTFRIERAGPPEDRLGGSRRFRVSASLAGREFETFLLDIGFRVIPMERVDALTTPDLLAFADVAPVTVPAIPLETQVAEKLHAYTRTYHDAQPSSRTKDLVDLVLIAELASLDAVTLRRAIETTFAVRGTHPVPATLPAPPPEWSLLALCGFTLYVEMPHSFADPGPTGWPRWRVEAHAPELRPARGDADPLVCHGAMVLVRITDKALVHMAPSASNPGHASECALADHPVGLAGDAFQLCREVRLHG